MADPRTFTLIGEFKDGITPELEKINKQLAALKANFAGVGSRKNTGFRGATKEIGKLVSAHKNLADSVKHVGNELRSTTSILQQYRREMGKAAAATRAFQKSGGSMGSDAFAKNMRNANREAQAYLRTLQQINAQSGRAPRMPRGGGTGRVSPPGGGGRGGRGGRGGGSGNAFDQFPMAEFTMAMGISKAISGPIERAIVSGFQIGVGMMTKPFQYFAQNFGERMQDEMTDLKAAGGFFSILKDKKGGFIKTFQDAVNFTQENNLIMDKMAATLPGATQDYIEVSKRISDSVARLVDKDTANAVKYAERLRKSDATNLDPLGLGAISGTGGQAQKRAIQTILADLTKDTVLAGQGGGTGPQGAMGAYGLPQLTERMLSQQDVSLGQFQRYAAIFRDPMIMSALQEQLPAINKTAANTAERAEAIKKLFQKVLPPELVERYRRTMAGVTEGFNTSIFGKESGLFGLGRKIIGLSDEFNEFGVAVKDASGKVQKANLSLYDVVRDVLVNLGQVFQPIVENIKLIYDPMKALSERLVVARKFTFKLLESFNAYMGGFAELGFEGGEKNIRASLATVANLLRYIGAIGEGDFTGIIKQLEKKKISPETFGNMMQGFIDKLLNSEAATKVGETIGSVVGTVLTEVSKVTGFLSGRIKASNKLFAGLKQGFDSAGGGQAFGNIFKDVFKSIFKVLLEIGKVIPLEAYVVMGLATVIPIMVQTASMLMAQRFAKGFTRFFDDFDMEEIIMNRAQKIFSRVMGVQPVDVKDLGSVITDPRRMLPGTAGGAIVPAGGGGAGVSSLMTILGRLTTIFAAIVIVGGGVENTMRQLSQAFSEMGANLNSSFGGLMDLLNVLMGFVGDLGRRIGELIGPLFGAKEGFDGLKVVLAPITLALQAFSQGVRGLALAFAEFRVFLARITGDKEYQKRIAERDKMKTSLAEDRGRINAYNASMQGPAALKAQVAAAQKELSTSTTIKADRSAELRAFIAASKGQAPAGAAATGAGRLAGGAPAYAAAAPAAPSPQLTATATNTAATAAATGQINQKAGAQIAKITQTNTTLTTINSTLGGIRAAILAQTVAIRAGNMAVVGAINNLASSGGLGGMGGMGGGIFNLPTGDGVKKVVSAGRMLQGMGLNVAENPHFGTGRVGRHAPGSYHYAGRAIDVTGPPAQLDAAYAKLKGTNPAELLWRTAGHYDHLHVAYATGYGMPFTNAMEAMRFERAMTPGSVKVGSITGNSAEGFGGGTTINGGINVTVNGSGVNDPDELASIIALKIGDAVAQTRAASVFV